MNIASLIISVLAGALVLLSSPAGLMGQSDGAPLNLDDRELFPAEFFSSLSELTEDELILAGLKSLYPQKILTSPPQLNLPEPTPPIVHPVETMGVYIRVKHLGEALPVIKDNLSQPLVVLDLRFLTADLDSTLTLGSYLSRKSTLRLTTAGEYPVPPEFINGSTVAIESASLRDAGQTVFTLSNHETRGPLETLLAQLETDGDIISVGASSAGDTAVFKPFPGIDSYYLINGELRPADGRSLVESGFVPRVLTTASAAEDRLGYESLREGVSLDDLVQTRVAKPRFDEARLLRERALNSLEGNEPLDEPGDEATDEVEIPQDPILRRALNIVKALEALGRIGG